MVYVKFGGDWPWGTDEIEECVGWHDAAHVISQHAAKGTTSPHAQGQPSIDMFSDRVRLATEGTLWIYGSKYVEVKKK